MICTTRSLSVLPAPHHPPPALRRLAFCIKPVWDLFIYYIRFLISSSFLSYLFVSNQGETKPFVLVYISRPSSSVVSTISSQEFLLLLWSHCTTVLECLDKHKATLGADHPHTLNSINNLKPSSVVWLSRKVRCSRVIIKKSTLGWSPKYSYFH